MTVRLALIRHGPTDWNGEKRFQGHVDRPLSEEGKHAVAQWRLPDDFVGFDFWCSPLTRCRQTAALVLPRDPQIDARLTEMSFGDWEGERIVDLREKWGDEVAERESWGLDFSAPGGESPRQVQDRVAPLFRDWAIQGQDRLAVCHKGVIRAVYAWARDWPMLGKPPDKLRWDCVHLFDLDRDGRPSVIQLNIPLAGGGDA